MQGSPGRIVVVSSEAHKFGSIDLEDLNWKQRKYNAWGVSPLQCQHSHFKPADDQRDLQAVVVAALSAPLSFA